MSVGIAETQSYSSAQEVLLEKLSPKEQAFWLQKMNFMYVSEVEKHETKIHYGGPSYILLSLWRALHGVDQQRCWICEINIVES